MIPLFQGTLDCLVDLEVLVVRSDQWDLVIQSLQVDHADLTAQCHLDNNNNYFIFFKYHLPHPTEDKSEEDPASLQLQNQNCLLGMQQLHAGLY